MTAWTDVGGSSRLVDVEVLMGDVVRRGGKPPFRATPGWLQTGSMPQLAVPMVAYLSFAALEERALERSPYPAALWRERFSGLEDEALLAKNHTGAGLMLLGNLAFLTGFARSEEKAALRTCVEEVMAKLEAGKADEVVNSAAEMPEHKGESLVQFFKRQGKSLRVAAVAKAGAQELVFFIDQQGGAFFVCFAFEKGEAGLRIRRIDLVDHAVFRQWVVQQTRELEGKSK